MGKLILASVTVLMTSTAAFAIANPASVFCEKLGGKSEVVTDRSGDELGLCRLKNGNLIEEWTLYRLLEGETK